MINKTKGPTVVSITPLPVSADSRTFKQASSAARFGYQSIVVEGIRSEFTFDSLPFKLITVPSLRRRHRKMQPVSRVTGTVSVRTEAASHYPASKSTDQEIQNTSEVSTPNASQGRMVERLRRQPYIGNNVWELEYVFQRLRCGLSERKGLKQKCAYVLNIGCNLFIYPLRRLYGIFLGAPPVQFLRYLFGFVFRYIFAPLAVTPRAHLYYLHAFYQFPAVYLLCLIHRAKFIYDAHDFYSQLEESAALPFFWRYWVLPFEQHIEKWCVRRADAIVTVNEGIAELMQQRFGCKAIVIRNAHDRRLDRCVKETIRSKIGLSPDHFLVVSIGNWKPAMAIEEAMVALTSLPDRFHLAFLGSGYRSYDKELLRRGLTGRVHFLAAVPPHDVVPFIEDADASIILYYAKSVNYENALPNRFFQPISAGLPIVYPPLPEIRRLAEQYGVGLMADPLKPAEITAALSQLSAAKRHNHNSELQATLDVARQALGWEREEQTLVSLIERLIGPAVHNGRSDRRQDNKLKPRPSA